MEEAIERMIFLICIVKDLVGYANLKAAKVWRCSDEGGEDTEDGEDGEDELTRDQEVVFIQWGA